MADSEIIATQIYQTIENSKYFRKQIIFSIQYLPMEWPYNFWGWDGFFYIELVSDFRKKIKK